MEDQDIHVVGTFIFTGVFNPHGPRYDDEEVARHFQNQWPARALEFEAWHKYFYPGQSRCVRCFIRRFDCDVENSYRQCSNCTSSGLQCTIASEFLAPENNSQVPESWNGAPFDDSLLPNVPPDDLLSNPPHEFVDAFATVNPQDYGGTPIDPALDPGYTMFSPGNVGNASSLGPTLDDLLEIPETDLSLPNWNAQGIPDGNTFPSYLPATSSWGAPSQPGQPVADTYPALPLQSPAGQPTQPVPTQPVLAPPPTSYQDPQLAAGQPNDFEPVPSDDIPSERSGPFRIRCDTCRQFPSGGAVQSKCRWYARENQHWGCDHCRRYGLVCVVDGAALPPNPTVSRNTAKYPSCNMCKLTNGICERQRPCESCLLRGATCDAGLGKGTIPRGAAYGAELYGYLSLVGGGPTGINCDERDRFPQEYEQPADYHIQYVRWVQGGPVPLPPGYSGPIPNPPRPNVQLRILNLPLPHQPPPRRSPPRVARPVMALPPPSSVPTQPSQSNMTPSTIVAQPSQLSPASAILFGANSNPAAAPGQGVTRPVVIPPGVGQDEIMHLSRGVTTISRVSEPSIVVACGGPTATLYDASGIQNPIPFENARLPYGHPERANLSLLTAPRPPHPNPEGTPSLRTVPDDHQMALQHKRRPTWQCIEHRGNRLCQLPTIDSCDELTHGDSVPVCSECNSSSRRRFEPALANISRGLRAYACGPCSGIAAGNPGHFFGKRFRVWGLPGNAFDADVGANCSISMGPPARMTGCDCGTKLLDRTLCTPHRLEHFLDVRAKAQAMRRYVASIWGRLPCPFCLNRVGVDAYNFRDEQDIPFPDIVYTCLSCLGVVISTPATHAAIGPVAP